MPIPGLLLFLEFLYQPDADLHTVRCRIDTINMETRCFKRKQRVLVRAAGFEPTVS